MRTLLFLLAAAPSIALAQPAAAPPAKTPSGAAVFARPGDPAGSDLAARFETELTRALIGKGVEVTDLDERFSPPAPFNVAEGDALMAQGMEAFNNLDPDAALSKFTDAATFFARHPVESPPEKMAGAFVAIGATSQLNGDAQKAQEAFRRAAILYPRIAADEIFGADAKAGLEAAKQKVADGPKGTVKIESQPQGARALLDGREVGLTPLPPEDAPVGRHHLLVKRPGYLTFGAYPDITPDQPTELEPILEPSPGLAQTLKVVDQVTTDVAFAASALPPEAKGLGEKLEARFLVVARVSSAPGGGAKAEVQTWDLTTGNKLDGLAVDLTHDDWRSTDQVAEQVRKWIAEPPPARAVSDSGPLYKKWWLWTAVGVVAVGATTVAVSQNMGHRPNFVLGLP